MTSAEILILGIFEDRAQEDFLRGLIARRAHEMAIQVTLEPRLTKGCRFNNLREHLEYGDLFHGTLIAVDGKKLKLEKKVAALQKGVRETGLVRWPDRPVLWSVASPSVEEWMMADAEALPQVLGELLTDPNSVPRPGKASAESTAKERLRGWAAGLAGSHQLLRGGLEYAEQVASRIDLSRVGASRNPDLKELLESKLPEFLIECGKNR